ncbi:cilia- and flagella-associated protein 54-like isoform X3 [Montipora foliosa]
MMVDAALFLWSKCKPHFQRVMSSSLENCKQLLNDVSSNRWLYVLTVVHSALSWTNAAFFDPILCAEVTLKYSLLLESKAGITGDQFRVSSAEMETPASTFSPEQGTDAKQEKHDADSSEKLASQAHLRSLSLDCSKLMIVALDGLGTGVRDLLNKVVDILDQGLNDIARSRDVVIDRSKQNIADISWIKRSSSSIGEKNDGFTSESDGPSLLEQTIEALHMELLFVKHRISVKLANLGHAPDENKNRAKKQRDKIKPSESSFQLSEVENTIYTVCNRNSLSKALLLMHIATSRGQVGTEHQVRLLQESQEMIKKYQQQERKTSVWNRQSNDTKDVSPSDVPSAPLLVYRSSSTLIFKAAPFKSTTGQKVAWYRLFARSANSSNVKARLNDYQLPGTGEEVPATADTLFYVRGLKPNEKYMAALAAYDENGKMIGGGIGLTCPPVLATHPLPSLMAWGYLAQLSFASGVLSIAKSAASVLWNHFVKESEDPEENSSIQSAATDICISLKRLDEDRLRESSPVLARLFLQSIFISVDSRIREGHLFCDCLCDNGPLYSGQLARLEECERLLLAIQVAGWLNDSALCLQAVVQSYGLLAPLIHQKIPAKPVVQVLLRCHAVLQEVPSLTRHRKSMSSSDSLSHMIATMTYYIAKILQLWNEQGVAGAILEIGKKMLNLDTAPDSAGTMTTMQAVTAMATVNLGGLTVSRSTKKKPGPTKKPKIVGGKGGLGKLEKEVAAYNADAQNEELKALEAYISKLSQQALNRDEEELTGSEDPSVLYSVVANLPAQQAYKEVIKFKRRTRFLGFYVQVLAKALQEGLTETALEWSSDTIGWMMRRNELLLGSKPTIIRQAAAAAPEDEKIRKFATAIVEFSQPPQKPRQAETEKEDEKEDAEIVVRNKQEMISKPPPPPRKSLGLSTISKKARRFTRKGRTAEEKDIYNAIERLQNVLPEYWRSSQRKKKLRAVSCEELPWRAQMGILLASANFDLFLDKMEGAQRPGDSGDSENPLYRPSLMDPDWFGYATAGTLIKSWAGASGRVSPDPPMGFSGSASEKPFAQIAPIGSRGNQRGAPAGSQGEAVRSGSRVTGFTVSDKEGSTTSKSPMFFLLSALDNLSRTIVLTYRGKFWTMLQNACRALWNITQTLLMRVVAETLHLCDDPLAEAATDIDVLRKVLWKKFYFGADSLLDMMVQIQEQIKAQTDQNFKPDKLKKGDLFVSEKQSIMGGVEDERGGASLLFEAPLDNTSAADTRWIKRFILCAVEMLFYECKWERTVSIILRFNALTRSRYAETVLPLLIVAQRKLHEQVEAHGGPSRSQPLITVSKETGIAEEFYIRPVEYMSIEPAVHIDPQGHNVYSGSDDALRLVSVPININDSLQLLHQALEFKHHTARSLEHSRQLLLCYLAGQQEGSSSTRVARGSSRVGFLPRQAKPPTDVPLDLSKEAFGTINDVQTFTLQPSQLAVVVASYDKTVEMLQFRKQKSLAAQAMHELGNIMFHSGNIRAAYKWWAESLDTILSASNSLKTWRDLTSSSDPSIRPAAVLLQRCGLWGCLLGGVLAADIAQYIHTSNLGLRLECCLLSAIFFKALFCSSLPHPGADKDYALYEVGNGCEVEELIPGIDLLSEAFRSNGRSVVASLRWITEELARARYLLTVLPLVTLCLYFTTHVSRDLQRSVDIRILKVRVLTDLGMLSEAIRVLMDLLRGEKLPKISDVGFRTVSSKTKSLPVFDNKESLLNPGNLAVLNYLTERRLHPSLSVLYGPHLAGQLTIAHAHLMITIASTIYAIPADCNQEITRHFESKEEEEAPSQLPIPPAPSQSQLGSKNSKKKVNVEETSLKSSKAAQKKHLLDASTATPQFIKGFLLATAEMILTNLCDSLTDAADQVSLEDEPSTLSSVDLEQICLSRLELAEIANQRHHAVTSGNIVYACMRALEDAAILNELDLEKRAQSLLSSQVRSAHSTVTGLGSNHYFQNQARCRLDARLWLTCRLALARGLAEEDCGMGKLGGSARSVTSSIGSCLHHCQQGLDEAEAFGDVELIAEFSLLNVVQNLREGKMGTDLLETLEHIISRLEQCSALSVSGKQLLCLSIIQYADIKPSSHVTSTVPYLNDSLTAYKKAMSYLLNQLTQLGSDVNLVESSPVLPLRNIYFPQLLPLIDIKLRLGRAFYKQIPPSDVIPTEWQAAVKELEMGLQLTRTSACQRKPVEAQMLFTLGQIQRQMLQMGHVAPTKVINTFVDAVQCTFFSDHDLGLMKQAYLEIALVLIFNARKFRPLKTPDHMLSRSPASPTRISDKPSTPKAERKISKRGSAREKDRKEKESREKNRELDAELSKAWASIRAAGLVSLAQFKVGILTGDPEITTLTLSETAASSIPGFALFDLLGTDDVIKSSEDGALVAQDGIVTMGTTINKSNRVQVTWLHLLGYLSVLRRQCSYPALGVQSKTEEMAKNSSSNVLPLFSSWRALKLSKMHSFLRNELIPYTTECCGVYPPEVLSAYGTPVSSGPQIMFTKLLNADLTSNTLKETDVVNKSVTSGDYEICIQWFQPEHAQDSVKPVDPESASSLQNVLFLLYALNNKALNLAANPVSSQVKAGLCRVEGARVHTLYEKLMATLETAENDLIPVQTTQTVVGTNEQNKARPVRQDTGQLAVPGNADQKSVTNGATARKKKSMGIRALSGKQRKDDHIKALLKEHLNEIQSILQPQKPVPVEDVSFEVNLSNVACLKAMFDPTLGTIGKTTEAFYTWLLSLLEN